MTNSNDYTPSFQRFKALAADHNLIPIYKTIPAGSDTPVTTFAKVRRGSYGFLLESAEVDNHNSRYSFIGTEPSEVIQTGKGTAHGETEPMHALADRLKPIRHAKIDGTARFRRRRCRIHRIRCHQILRAQSTAHLRRTIGTECARSHLHDHRLDVHLR